MVLLCQTQNQMRDNNGEPNGRFWRVIPDGEKELYLFGVKHGMDMAGAVAELKYPGANAVIQEGLPGHFTVGDYMSEFDLFYKDTENVLITLPMAFSYCSIKLKGTWTKEALEKGLILLRKDAAKNY
jgi:hypothetical protein